MKLLLLSIFLSLTGAKPTPTWTHKITVERSQSIEKAATVSDKATIGFATLNGGTTGGLGGTVTTVSTLAQFTAAVSERNKEPAIVLVQGVIEGNTQVRIGSNKTIIGLPGSGFKGVALEFKRQRNLILRNIVSSSVLASAGDGLEIATSTNVWVDHCEFHSVKGNDKDLYDGLIDVSHGSDFITISHTYFHDHWKTSLVGHSDSNGGQDKGHLRITYANNHWKHCGSRGPSLRFGTGHIYNSLYEDMQSAINTRMGAQVLVESNVFRKVAHPITSDDSKETGFAVAFDNDLGAATNHAPNGNLTAALIPYEYMLLGTVHVETEVPKMAGATLKVETPPASNSTTLPPLRGQVVRKWTAPKPGGWMRLKH